MRMGASRKMQVKIFYIPMQEPGDSSSALTSDSNIWKMSKQQKGKGLAKDPNILAIYENVPQFVEVVGTRFKAMVECVVRNAETIALKEETSKEVEGKKKLIGDVIFNINELCKNEALIILQKL